MARTTKLELQQALTLAGEELRALRTEVSGLRADNERLRAQLADTGMSENDMRTAIAKLDALRAADPADPPFDTDGASYMPPEYEVAEPPATECVAPATKNVAYNRYHKSLGIRPAWQPSAAMQAARDLAMRTGRVVRVG